MKNIFPFYPRGAVVASLALVTLLAVAAHTLGLTSALTVTSVVLFTLILLAAAQQKLWLLFVYVLLIILPFPYFTITFVGPLSIVAFVALLAIGLLVVGFVVQRPVWRLSLAHLPIGLFAAAVLVSFAINSLVVQQTDWILLGCAIVLTVLVAQTASPRTARYLLLSWIAGATLFALARMLHLDTIVGAPSIVQTSAVLLPVWAFLTANWIAADRSWHFLRRGLVLLGIVFLSLPLLATANLAILVVMLLVIVKATFMGPRGRSNFIAVTLLLAILALCFVASNTTLAITIPSFATILPYIREQYLSSGIVAILFGTTANAFLVAFGVVGLIIVLAMVLRLLIRLIWLAKLSPSVTRRAQAIAAMSALLCAMFFALWPEYLLHFWLIFTIAVAIYLQRTSQGATTPALPTIIHIVPSFEKIGPVEGVRDLTRGLTQEFTPIVVALMREGSHHGALRIEKEFAHFGVQTIQYDYLKPFDVLAIYRLWRLFKQVRPQIVHTHLTRPDFYGRVAAHLAGVPFVISTIRSPNQWLGRKDPLSRLIAIFDRTTAAYCTAVVAVSESVRDYLIANRFCDKEKISVIENAIDIDRFYRPDTRLRWRKKLHVAAEHFVIGTVSRAHPVKNIPLILKSAVAITKKYPAARFVIVGRGPDFATLQKIIHSKGLESTVQLLGERDDIPQILAALDLFLLPSRYEGFPLALAQAMTAGLPCIGTDVSGIRVMISDQKTGILFPDNDAAALTAAIGTVIDNPALAQRLGQQARAMAVRRFDYRRMVQQYQDLYRQYML